MITAKDLMDIEYFLGQRARIINQPEEDKLLIAKLRTKIANELDKIKINLKQEKKKK